MQSYQPVRAGMGSRGLPMFTIGKLANQAGVTVETVRFYQRNELLDVPEFQGKQRYYQQAHVRRLRFIKGAQAAGFSLKEIKQLLVKIGRASCGNAVRSGCQ